MAFLHLFWKVISSPIIATTAVSALGGPITFVIGIAVLVGGAIYGLFHRNAWKGKLAQSLKVMKNKMHLDNILMA